MVQAINPTYPISLAVSKDFLEDLIICEEGLQMDVEIARENGDESAKNRVIFNDFSSRAKTRIRIENDKELEAAWFALASGTIGESRPATANRLLDELRPYAMSVCPNQVKVFPRQATF